MVSSVLTALITAGSAIGGGLVVAGSNVAMSRLRASAQRIGDLRLSLAALLSVLGQIETELLSVPRSKRTVRVVNEQMETRFPQIDYITGRLHRRIFQPHLDGLTLRFHDAMSAVLLTAPAELLPALQAVAEAMEDPVIDSNDRWTRWRGARSGLVVASRHVLGHEIPNAAESQ
jgi:hypothetical protein